MIYITGDIHGEPRRFNKQTFPDQERLTRADYLIICGDFGLVWDPEESKRERWWLDWLDEKPYTTCFIDGNHENFTRLQSLPTETWNAGTVHKIREHVIHLMRGEYYCIGGTSLFTFGGARSHDIRGLADDAALQRDYTAGVLKQDDPLFLEKKKRLERKGGVTRVEEKTWWRAEMPSESEMRHGMETLRKHGGKVDVILSHEGPFSLVALLEDGAGTDPLMEYLERVKQGTEYSQWFFGHHHMDRRITEKDTVVYEKILRI